MDNTRIKSIYEAATKLFISQGYSKTQISHIAKAVGISVGTIYHDFTGKKEIMHFILKCTIDPEFIKRDFERPITDDIFVDIEEEIANIFETSADTFSENLKNAEVTYSFEDLISDTFDMFYKYAAGCLFIEKNQLDCVKLANSYKSYRKRFFGTMTEFMRIFINKGVIRPLKHVELTTNLIIEILTWWAMDARYSTFETIDIPKEQAKQVCMDNIISAYKVN